MSFPPGFMHMVITHQPCVKFAWDIISYDLFEKYLDIARDLISGYYAHEENADDYIGLQEIVWGLLVKIAEQCYPDME